MKTNIAIGLFIVLTFQVWTQQAPTIGTNQGQTSIEYWSRAGNNGGSNNLFGTKFNSPIYTVTGSGFAINGNTYRSKLNAIYGNGSQYSINGYGWNQGVNTTGYMLLGPDAGVSSTGQSIYTTKGAFSLLHLHGSGIVQEFGYRPWMKTGITLSDNNDMSYIGLRQVGTGIDVTEMVVNWTDNDAGIPFGSDDLTFRFSSGG
jgi:hypothetical protein